jgi:hypothetical protein
MTSPTLGKDTSEIEVSNIFSHGFWIFVADREFFLAYDQYPWFRNATLNAIFDVQLLHGRHLHWPQLDVDIELDSLTDPDRYPLISKVEPGS